MHKGVLRLGCSTRPASPGPQLVPPFQKQIPGIDVQLYQGSYADIVIGSRAAHSGTWIPLNSSARGLDFEPLYDDPLVCIASADYQPHRPGCVRAARNCRAGRSSASN